MLARVLEMPLVGGSQELCVVRTGNVHAAATKAGDDAHVDTLVRVQAQRQGPDLRALGRALITVAQRSDERAILVPLASDLVLMVVVVGERRMDGGEVDVRMRLDDLVRSHALVLVFGGDLTDLERPWRRYRRTPWPRASFRGTVGAAFESGTG